MDVRWAQLERNIAVTCGPSGFEEVGTALPPHVSPPMLVVQLRGHAGQGDGSRAQG